MMTSIAFVVAYKRSSTSLCLYTKINRYIQLQLLVYHTDFVFYVSSILL